MLKFYFFDTNVLLSHLSFVKEQFFFYISSVTFEELEKIKSYRNYSDSIKYAAREATRFLDESNNYEVVFYRPDSFSFAGAENVEDSPDNRILACAALTDRNRQKIVFCSSDKLCRLTAKNIFQLATEAPPEYEEDDYKGFCVKCVESEDELAYFYEHQAENIYDLLTNEYLVLQDVEGSTLDLRRWDGHIYDSVKYTNLKTDFFGTVKPYNGDIYQQMALNSFAQNQVTMLKGVAGTGKSYLALAYLFWLLEKHKIDKIIIFCNPVATANSAKLGFYPGSRDKKLLDSQIGTMLGSKLGGAYGVEQMVREGKIMLVPMSDIRGFDTTGTNSAVYITEAQNMDIALMKLALQRIGEDTICIIDGDYTAQVDLSSYAGENNGMRRMSEVFRGQDFYGEVELQNIYRSRIASVAADM